MFGEIHAIKQSISVDVSSAATASRSAAPALRLTDLCGVILKWMVPRNCEEWWGFTKMNKNGQTLGSKFENFRNGAVFIMFWKTARDKPSVSLLSQRRTGQWARNPQWDDFGYGTKFEMIFDPAKKSGGSSPHWSNCSCYPSLEGFCARV